MKLKLDDSGNAVLQDGMPVFVDGSGNEKPFSPDKQESTIKRLNAEAQANRERAEQAEFKLKSFDGLDADAAKVALESMSKLDQKKLIDAGEVDKVRQEISEMYQAKLDEADKAKAQLQEQLYNEKIGGSFGRSKFINERMAIPADIVQAMFGNRFKVENGEIVAYNSNGEVVRDLDAGGKPADFDKALESLVGEYSNKDSILKAQNKDGMGATVASGSTITKGDFAGSKQERLTAIKRMMSE